MARASKKTGFAACLLCLSPFLSAGMSAAQEPPLPLSHECLARGTATANETRLPNIVQALQDRKRIRILTIGASASTGRGTVRGGYAAIIEQMLEQAIKGLDVVIINRGVSGELAEDAAFRIRTEVALTEPDLVLWQVGTNDALAYVPVDRIGGAVVETVRWLRANKVDVVLVGLQYAGAMTEDSHYQAVRRLLRDIAAKEGVTIVRRYEAMQIIAEGEKTGTGPAPDEFDRSDAGYGCLAQYVARAIALGLFGKGIRPQAPR